MRVGDSFLRERLPDRDSVHFSAHRAGMMFTHSSENTMAKLNYPQTEYVTEAYLMANSFSIK